MSHLLLVEDDDTVRDTLALNLRAEGYEVDTAADGEEGLRLARQASPDLIILDVMLPKLDGLTVCRLVRRESQVPILLLTARGTETDKIIGLETGADDYVVKPFSLGELLARVHHAIRRAGPGQRRESPKGEVDRAIARALKMASMADTTGSAGTGVWSAENDEEREALSEAAGDVVFSAFVHRVDEKLLAGPILHQLALQKKGSKVRRPSGLLHRMWDQDDGVITL